MRTRKTNNLKPITNEKLFGTGKVIFHCKEEFPSELDYNGCHWYRSEYEYTVIATGMSNFLYETYDREEDLRLYVDAAGHIWDEKEAGIF